MVPIFILIYFRYFNKGKYMTCNRVKLELTKGATPEVINRILRTVSYMSDDLFKSYRYRNGTLYINLGYDSKKCDEITQAMINTYNSYYDD